MEQTDVFKLSGKLSVPYFVMAGEDDSLGDVACTFEHMNRVPGPKTLVLFAGEEHGMGGSRSSQLGPPFFPMIADWLMDSALGRPLQSTYIVVNTLGQVHAEPWEKTVHTNTTQSWVEQLFSEKPPVGLS